MAGYSALVRVAPAALRLLVEGAEVPGFGKPAVAAESGALVSVLDRRRTRPKGAWMVLDRFPRRLVFRRKGPERALLAFPAVLFSASQLRPSALPGAIQLAQPEREVAAAAL